MDYSVKMTYFVVYVCFDLDTEIEHRNRIRYFNVFYVATATEVLSFSGLLFYACFITCDIFFLLCYRGYTDKHVRMTFQQQQQKYMLLVKIFSCNNLVSASKYAAFKY